ncbi:beta-1,4-galactosyltransferase galt-1-like [Tachypleus tridentatus]|uniref:beta-1,4-galactosyltransferase galt-1-like n=1 Tax=Tachypleus tridentatus TaxID=6853 RepID=UPI003FD0C18C
MSHKISVRWKSFLAIVFTGGAVIFLQHNEISHTLTEHARYSTQVGHAVPVSNPLTSVIDSFIDAHSNMDNWKRVATDVYIYSAYWDDRDRLEKPSVVVMAAGVRKSKNLSSINCVFSNDTQSEEYAANTTFEILKEHHHKYASGILFYCQPLFDKPSLYVTLRFKNIINNIWIPIRKFTYDTKVYFTNTTALCMRPLYGNLNISQTLAEFIAFYQAIGVSHFSFYNAGITNATLFFLTQLRKNGISITLNSWDLPEDLRSIWAMGQMVAIQDCIYRHMSYDLLVIVDLDEFIVPQKKYKTTLQKIVQDVDKRLANKSHFLWGSYVFRQTFFCVEYHSININKNSNLNLITQTKLLHESKIWPYCDRSKYILRPQTVKMGGIHCILKHLPGFKIYLFPSKTALIHHYREGIRFCKNKNTSLTVSNRAALTYRQEILNSKALQRWIKFIKS